MVRVGASVRARSMFDATVRTARSVPGARYRTLKGEDIQRSLNDRADIGEKKRERSTSMCNSENGGTGEREKERRRVDSWGTLPCLEVAEFLGDDLADVNAEPVDDPLGKIRMRRPAEDLDVGHSAL